MGIFGVIDNNIITNVIVADSKEIAETVAQKECIEQTEQNQLGIGYYWSEEWNKYISPSPFLSWQYDGYSWQPPIPYPTNLDRYDWNEELLNWEEVSE